MNGKEPLLAGRQIAIQRYRRRNAGEDGGQGREDDRDGGERERKELRRRWGLCEVFGEAKAGITESRRSGRE